MTIVRMGRIIACATIVATLGATPLVAISHAEDAATGGMRVYRDPVTGEFTTPPPNPGVADAQSTSAGARALTRTPAAPVEEPGTSAAGGVTMELQGRFRSDATATIDADGALHPGCHSAERAR